MLDADLSPEAIEDMLGIDDRTIKSFGYDQADRLEEEFANAFRLLNDNPKIGRERTEISKLGSRLRSWTVLGRFFVVYYPKVDGVYIVRIIDVSRDIQRLLKIRKT